jgi:acyl transferase domain-containing protein
VAGALNLADACALVAARARLMQAMPPGGAMVSVRASEADVLPLLEGHERTVSVAAVNGPESVVISGDRDTVLGIARQLRSLGHKTKRLRVSHAFHSPHMDDALEDLTQVAAGLSFTPPTIPVVSNVTGAIAAFDDLRDPRYWARQVRRAVRFHDGLRRLRDAGVTTYVEVGPGAVLTPLAHDSLAGTGSPLVVPALRADRDEPDTVTSALALAHLHGVPIDWRTLLGGGARAHVDLPTYPFQRRRYWLDAGTASDPASATLESGFWDAVERADSTDLAAALQLDTGQVSSLDAVLPALATWRRQRFWRYRVVRTRTSDGSTARRLVRAAVRGPGRGWVPRGTVLVTGGTEGLGAHAARWLARHGADHVVLTATDVADTTAADALVAELAGFGTRATVVVGDTADGDVLADMIAAGDEADPLTAVVHAAGADATAVANLDEATRGLDLDAFVVFTPLPQEFDAFAAEPGHEWRSPDVDPVKVEDLIARRHADRLPALAVAWGPWRTDAVPAGALRSLAPGLAMSVLDEATTDHDPFLVVVDVDWERVAAGGGHLSGQSSFFHDVPEIAQGRATVGPDDAPRLLERLADADDTTAEEILVEVLRSHAAAVLGHTSTEGIGLDSSLLDLGFSSFTALELSNRLNESTGIQVPSVAVFDHPTLSALARYLRTELTTAAAR